MLIVLSTTQKLNILDNVKYITAPLYLLLFVMSYIIRPFQLFKKAHVLADWNSALHLYHDTDDLGYLKLTLQKVRTHTSAERPYTFELRAGFIIETYDYMKATGYYAMTVPLYAAAEDVYFSPPSDGWTIHPCLQDAFDALYTRAHVMGRDGWKIVKRVKSTKTRYEFETRTPPIQAKL